ncbi:MAG: hypothetical protein K9N23_04090 [Akkermansiaceae bacterium]|nr:hypothetical protein [Akkermansiaceae bacterium]MCF7730839.1 hypothetical protein [Akkermansiaceae bacterium]
MPCILVAQEPSMGTVGSTTQTVDPNSPDVTKSTTYDLGDRKMVVQEVTETTLPIQPVPAPPVPTAKPSSKLPPELAARLALLAKRRSLSFGGTVYITASGTRRSLIACHPPEGGQPVVFWSSIDWDLLRVGRFVSPEGLEYTLMNMVTTIDIARASAMWARRGRSYQAPAIPEFAAGAASYRIVSGNPSPAMLSDLNVIHAIYDREHAALIALQLKRDEARSLAIEAAKQPQPPPPDIIIQGRPMTPEELAPPSNRQPATTTP